MKKYGLRIGDIGIEFPSIDERQKALIDFTKGCDVKISDSGIVYKDGKGTFSVYERDTKEVIVVCCQCEGQFGIDSCPNREYPYKYYNSKDWSTSKGYICDSCLAKKKKEKEVEEAKKVLEGEQT